MPFLMPFDKNKKKLSKNLLDFYYTTTTTTTVYGKFNYGIFLHNFAIFVDDIIAECIEANFYFPIVSAQFRLS